MGQPYVGEIRMFGGNFAPAGWAFCNGQLLPISENDVLFNLIGTTYGGDGQSTFGVPDLQGRIPLHMGTLAGTNYTIGQNGGTESVTLVVGQIPQHTHTFSASKDNALQPNPANNALGALASFQLYTAAAPASNLAPAALAPQGGGQPHDNLMPTLCVSFIISLFGVFPSQT